MGEIGFKPNKHAVFLVRASTKKGLSGFLIGLMQIKLNSFHVNVISI